MDYLSNNYIFLVIKFTVFYLFLFFLGRAFLLLFKKDKQIDNHKLLNLDIQFIYQIIGLIILGNYLVILNFFLPLKTIFSFFIFLLIFLNYKFPPTIDIFKKLASSGPIYMILLISSYNIFYHYDAGLYHLNNQFLIRENNIILGISNIYGPYGVGSIYEYISSIFWFDNTFVLLHFLNIVFAGFFFDFIFRLIFKSEIKVLKNIGLSLLLYSVLDNFGYLGGRNGLIYIQGIGKQDVAISVLFLLTVIMIIYNIKNKNHDSLDMLIVSLLTLFIYQLKVSGVIIFLFYIYYIVYLFRNKILKDININSTLIPIILAFIWILKSILTTGCLIFPLAISCFDKLSWVDKDYIRVIEEISVGYSISYNFGDSIANWFNSYISVDLNRSIILNFIISYLLISFIFFSKERLKKEKNFDSLIKFLIILTLLFYLNFGPDPRYLMTLQILLIALIGLWKVPRFTFSKPILYTLFIFAVISFVRIDSYKQFDFLSHPNYEIPKPELIKIDERYIPEEGDQCWANIKCSANNEKYNETKNKYFKIVKLEN
tara:strand:- start:2754 stop:4382 length:1629 start_codon:yes stop_codon:yes gene_type:complete